MTVLLLKTKQSLKKPPLYIFTFFSDCIFSFLCSKVTIYINELEREIFNTFLPCTQTDGPMYSHSPGKWKIFGARCQTQAAYIRKCYEDNDLYFYTSKRKAGKL